MIETLIYTFVIVFAVTFGVLFWKKPKFTQTASGKFDYPKTASIALGAAFGAALLVGIVISLMNRRAGYQTVGSLSMRRPYYIQ